MTTINLKLGKQCQKLSIAGECDCMNFEGRYSVPMDVKFIQETFPKHEGCDCEIEEKEPEKVE